MREGLEDMRVGLVEGVATLHFLLNDFNIVIAWRRSTPNLLPLHY